MRIIDLSEEHNDIYHICLEDWSQEMKEAGNHKSHWHEKMKDKDLRVKLAIDDNGVVGGMIQYLPAEYSFIDGNDIYFIQCIWVHGYKEGRGDFRRQGMGKALIAAAESDAKELGAKGIAAWGILLPVWMKASWFKKQGFKKADRLGIQVLLWKPFTPDAVSPRWISQKKKPEIVNGKVTVTAFLNGWCPAQNIAFERTKRAVSEFGDAVVFHEINTSDRKVFLEWGISDAVFVDHKQVRTGPPPSYEKIRTIISKKVKKLR